MRSLSLAITLEGAIVAKLHLFISIEAGRWLDSDCD